MHVMAKLMSAEGGKAEEYLPVLSSQLQKRTIIFLPNDLGRMQLVLKLNSLETVL